MLGIGVSICASRENGLASTRPIWRFEPLRQVPLCDRNAGRLECLRTPRRGQIEPLRQVPPCGRNAVI